LDILIYSVIVFIYGITIGSFLNVVIYRIPNNLSVVSPPSACPSCGNRLKMYHNIPILSWLLLRGKCGFCKTKISFQYPLIELITGIIFLLIFFKIGWVWYLPFVCLSFASLLALSMIDFKYMAVPDSVNFTALGFALIQPEFISAGIAALVTAGVLYVLGYIASKLARKEAMGLGDVIVAGTMGALLGFPNVLFAIFLSAILILVPSLLTKGKAYPFVPFLSMATLILFIYDNEILLFIKNIYGIA